MKFSCNIFGFFFLCRDDRQKSGLRDKLREDKKKDKKK
jgi:hypothetical protein